MYKSVISEMKAHMEKTAEDLRKEYQKIRTGRASTALLEEVKVDYYGNPTPIPQVASITTPDAKTMLIQPWDKKMIPAIEKAIMVANLGLNPANDGTIIRIPIPQLNEERRKELVKLGKKYAEDGRVAIRNVRREANEHIKKAEKNHEVSEDDSKLSQDKIQKMTDDYIKKIDDMIVQKEKEIMEV